MSRIRQATAAVTAAALLGTGGIGIAQAATSTSTSSDGSSSSSTRGPRPDGPRGGGPVSSAQLAKIASTLGVTSAQLKAALDANKPAKPAAGEDRGAAMATELATALGVEVAKVKEILDANRPAKPAQPASGRKPAGKPPKRSNTKLIAALASGLNLDTATVKAALDTIAAAHKADHVARQIATYAAIAADLGVSADAVKAAFEANRPAKPGPLGPRP